MSEPLECLDDYGDGECSGPVEFRMALSATGKSFPRCENHWDLRLKKEDENNEKYPVNAPSDFSYLDAGEYWGEDDY